MLKPDGVRGMYMLGENPFLSDPNINKVRKALAALDFLVVQDIFLTETAEFADVILPASSYLEKDGSYTNTDRRVQLGRKVMDPPGQARVDWEVVQDIAQRVGLDWSYTSPSEVFDEMVALMPSYANLRHDNLGLSGKLYPNADPEHTDGTIVLFDERFNTDDGLAHLVPAQWLPAKELPDAEYPLVLNTGRLLEHWHTGSMTRRSFALDTIAPIAEVYLHPKDAADRGLAHGELVRVRSRRGVIELQVRISHREQLGNVFIPFHFREAAANLLTIDEIDPFGKIPEFKFCAVQVEALGAAARAERVGDGTGSARMTLSPERAAQARARRVPGVEGRAGKFPGPSLIPALNAIQARLGWLPREELEELAREVRRPRYEIEGLISFYPHFRTTPPAKVALHVCHDLSCWARSGEDRIAELRARYGEDTDVEFVEVSCLGRCDVAPAAAVNEHPGAVSDVDSLVVAARGDGVGEPVAARPDRAVAERPVPGGLGCRGAVRVAAGVAARRAARRGHRGHAVGVRAARHGRRGLPHGQEVGAGRRHRTTRSSTRSATPTSPSRARSRTGRSSPTSRTSCSKACCSAWPWSAPSRAGCSSATSTAPRNAFCARRSTRCARPASSDPTRAAAGAGSTSRSSSRRAATSSARRPRCWSAWRATAANRGTSRRSPAPTACTGGRR